MATRRALFALLVLVPLLLAGCSRLQFGSGLSAVIHPTIVPSAAETGSEMIEYEFSFENEQTLIAVPIDRAIYAGATDSQKSAIFFGESEPAGWVGDYYRAFIDEEHQAAFYDSLAEALDQVRQQRGLDDDRYVELVTSFVQSMEYRTDPGDLAPKFPIETYGDRYGDCDDKTLLAAALLSRAGYDVAILVFPNEEHVALGIRAPELDYKDTGYAYVEATAPSLVGVPVEELSTGARLTSRPEVIKIGQGAGRFTAGEQIAYIQKRQREVRAARERLHARVTESTTELRALEAALAESKRKLQAVTDPTSLQTAIERYNAQVRTYNERAGELNRIVDRYNELLDVERFVAEHQTARPQVDERLRSVQL